MNTRLYDSGGPSIPPPAGGRLGGGQSCATEQVSPHPNPPPAGEGVHCGTCTRCLDICPTQAFTEAGKLDARRCIAYLTIEHKGRIPLEFRKAIGNRIYGCDDCLAVCPWNKFAQASREAAYHPRRELEAPLLRDLVQLNDAAFRTMFAKSPVKRIGRNRFVRNVLVAIGNSGDASLCETVEPLLKDPSPLVAEMAGWALEQLVPCA
jgi:epoxyqueuosine reductase